MSKKRIAPSGCKHPRIWQVRPKVTSLMITAPDFPGVGIEAQQIDFCEKCGKFRVIGDEGQESPWKHVKGFTQRAPGKTEAQRQRKLEKALLSIGSSPKS